LTIVRAENLTKIFGSNTKQALSLLRQGQSKDEILRRTGSTIGVDQVSFEVREGEIFVIMGLSGSGKSTLVRLLNRLIEPSSGAVHFRGENILDMPPKRLRELRRQGMSMVFQSFALMSHLTILENVAFGLDLGGMTRAERERRGRTALAQVGLADWAGHRPDQLSGGMQQRVGLARALANDPEVMLMDEAFSALDPIIRTEMQDELLRLQSESRRTVIFISHDLNEAMRIGDRIGIMKDGRMIQVDTPDEILRSPADAYVASFFRGVDPAQVLKAGDICRKTQVTLIDHQHGNVRTAIQQLESHDREHGYVLDRHQRLLGVVSLDRLKQELKRNPEPKLLNAVDAGIVAVHADTLLSDIICTVARLDASPPVINEQGRYLGVITKARLLEALDRSDETALLPAESAASGVVA